MWLPGILETQTRLISDVVTVKNYVTQHNTIPGKVTLLKIRGCSKPLYTATNS